MVLIGSGTGSTVVWLFIKSRSSSYFLVELPCSLMGASQSQEVTWAEYLESLKSLAPAVRPKLVPPCTTQTLKDRLLSSNPLKSFLKALISNPCHFSPQWVSHPEYTSPPNISLLLNDDDFQRRVYQSKCCPSLIPMLDPFQQCIYHLMQASSQQKLHQTQRFFHIWSKLKVCWLSLPYEPNQFQICSRMMLPPFIFKKGLITLDRAVKQMNTQSSQSLFDARIFRSLMPNSLAGRPPKSHSAHTQGPGLNSTCNLYLAANSKNPNRSLSPFLKSNTPGVIQWKFQKIQTLTVFKPSPLIICRRCSQYSLGTLEKWISPALIGTYYKISLTSLQLLLWVQFTICPLYPFNGQNNSLGMINLSTGVSISSSSLDPQRQTDT